MFRAIDGTAPERVGILLDGEVIEVPAGVSVAAALLLTDRLPTRYSAISGAPRAPFCMMGACFECLVDVDGVRGRRACQVKVRPGMRVTRHRGVAAADGETS